MKHISRVILAVLLTAYVLLVFINFADNKMALLYASKLDSKVSFEPQKHYLRINGVVDQFMIPSYVWGKRHLTVNNGIPHLTVKPMVKLLYFDAKGEPKLLYVKIASSTRFSRTSGTFDSNIFTPYEEIPSDSVGSELYKQGAKMKASVIVGSPSLFPDDGMTITDGMKFAAKFARQPSKFPFLANRKQLPLEGTVFLTDYIFLYP